MRVVANGSVVLHARERARGRLSDISSSGLRAQLAQGEPRLAPGEAVEVELHLDRGGASWLRFAGEVLREHEGDIAVRLTAVPLEFSRVVPEALLSALESAAFEHVLLVDAAADRRGSFAALLRRSGCRVTEAATPLEAISHLGGSPIQRWLVAISDTTPASVADELRSYLAEPDAPPVEVVALGEHAPTNALAWFAALGRAPC